MLLTDPRGTDHHPLSKPLPQGQPAPRKTSRDYDFLFEWRNNLKKVPLQRSVLEKHFQNSKASIFKNLHKNNEKLSKTTFSELCNQKIAIIRGVFIQGIRLNLSENSVSFVAFQPALAPPPTCMEAEGSRQAHTRGERLQQQPQEGAGWVWSSCEPPLENRHF